MSRSRAVAMSVLALLLTLAAPSVLAAPHTTIDAIGSVDYSQDPAALKVGMWARYHITGRSEGGVTDEYTATVLIAGEEDWWGESCFWVETQTQLPGGDVLPAATLMSYDAFGDTLPPSMIVLYQRKRIGELAEDGSPVTQLMRRGPNAVKARFDPRGSLTWKVDTLGTDTVRTPKGDFVCVKVRQEQGASQLGESADSTQYMEMRKARVTYFNPAIPITRFAREELESSTQQRTWLTGRSRESGPMRLMDRATGTVELVDFGTSGVTSLLVPEQYRRSLAEQRQSNRPRAGATVHPAGQTRTTAR